MSGGERRARVAQLLRSALSAQLRTSLKDPRVSDPGLLSINHVDVNRDMSVAHVYVSLLGGSERDLEVAVAALRGAAGALRGPLGRELRLKRAPELRFLPDHSAEVGARISEIVRGDADNSESE